MFVSPVRRAATAGALSVFVLLFGAGWYVTNPKRISRLSESLLSKVLGGHVTVKSGRLSLSGTLLLSGVELRTADPEPMPGGDVPIFSAEQIEARFDWVGLLSGQLTATQLVAAPAGERAHCSNNGAVGPWDPASTAGRERVERTQHGERDPRVVGGQRHPSTDTSRCRCGRDDRHYGARDCPPRGPNARCGNWSRRLRAPDVLVGGATKTMVDGFALVARPSAQVHDHPTAA